MMRRALASARCGIGHASVSRSSAVSFSMVIGLVPCSSAPVRRASKFSVIYLADQRKCVPPGTLHERAPKRRSVWAKRLHDVVVGYFTRAQCEMISAVVTG